MHNLPVFYKDSKLAMIELPEPKFVVFYNGTENLPDVSEQRLSDAYQIHTSEPDLELKITVLNINEGHNQELAAKSPTLHQYMIFVDTIRKYQEYMDFDAAMELAVNECIKNGILADFLKRNKAEVLRMSIFEYDQEEHLRMEREEANMGLSLENIAEAVKVSVDTVAQWLNIEGISVN